MQQRFSSYYLLLVNLLILAVHELLCKKPQALANEIEKKLKSFYISIKRELTEYNKSTVESHIAHIESSSLN